MRGRYVNALVELKCVSYNTCTYNRYFHMLFTIYANISASKRFLTCYRK